MRLCATSFGARGDAGCRGREAVRNCGCFPGLCPGPARSQWLLDLPDFCCRAGPDRAVRMAGAAGARIAGGAAIKSCPTDRSPVPTRGQARPGRHRSCSPRHRPPARVRPRHGTAHDRHGGNPHPASASAGPRHPCSTPAHPRACPCCAPCAPWRPAAPGTPTRALIWSSNARRSKRATMSHTSRAR